MLINADQHSGTVVVSRTPNLTEVEATCSADQLAAGFVSHDHALCSYASAESRVGFFFPVMAAAADL